MWTLSSRRRHRTAAHSANFNEKVHKPQSKSYGRIGANMQLIFTHILWIWILLSVHHNFLGSEGLQGTHIDALNPFSSKLMALTLRGGLWTFLANLALCVARATKRRSRPYITKEWKLQETFFVIMGRILCYNACIWK